MRQHADVQIGDGEGIAVGDGDAGGRVFAVVRCRDDRVADDR